MLPFFLTCTKACICIYDAQPAPHIPHTFEYILYEFDFGQLVADLLRMYVYLLRVDALHDLVL